MMVEWIRYMIVIGYIFKLYFLGFMRDNVFSNWYYLLRVFKMSVR